MSNFSIDGLISGLNTTEVINKLLEIERAPARRLEARKAELSARASAWRALRTKLVALEDRAAGLANRLTGLAATAASSNPSVVSATAAAGAAPGLYALTVNRLASVHQISTDTVADPDAQVFGVGTLTVTVGASATEVAIVEGQNSLAGIASAINASGAGVSAVVVQVDGGYRLLLTSKTTGAQGAVSVDATNLSGGSAVLSFPHEVNPAQDAEVVLGTGSGAVTVHRPSNIISDLIPGVTLALGGTGTGTVTVEWDREAVKKSVREFVTAYNELVDALARYGRYDATTGQRGALQGDGTLQRIQAQLPDGVLRTEVPDQVLKRLTDLGVQLGRDGRLTLDESKLAEALQGRFDQARRVLEALGSRMRDLTDGFTRTGGPVQAALDGLEVRLRSLDRQVSTWEARVEQKRQQLMRTFTNLERALGQLRSQGDWLALQLRQLAGRER